MSSAHHVAPSEGRPITVAIVNDYEVVVRGLAATLAPHDDRVNVVELNAGSAPTQRADIALFDTFAGRLDAIERARDMVRDGVVRHVVLYTWDASGQFLAAARTAGVSGVVLKSHTGEELVAAIEQVMAGKLVGFDRDARGTRHSRTSTPSDREREVLALIALGFTNAEIAAELFVSVDTVKTYVKRLYVKLGVVNRTQAALVAIGHELAPPSRRATVH